ncbi:class I SAM-dependent methyltransferase [Paenibacillus eucommiae]|uniref:SAM-dependent methyltransferase n=1 Tax=Paenibacillus eucommiae TaxID=1355755 RepID=A0ABS4JAN5_9BACL|nr:class I SAM-dependent methyltransferase [Paenibacillus eucommiae]MBP1996913.1 SAM-dependent methyltransferase [Paenibacillus eucommiae]
MKYLDMLTKLGVGNAHPGGYEKTLLQLEKYPLQAGSKVLEVGCGTGRTACLLAEQGCEVTALDIRPEMLDKARIRAQTLELTVRFVEGDACSLPFEEGEFDIVLVESVTNFTDTSKAVSEYNRVLRPGGKLFDREVIRWKKMPAKAERALCDFYGVKGLLSMEEWQHTLESQGFTAVSSDDVVPFPPYMWEDAIRHPDPVKLADHAILMDPQVWRLSSEYDQLMEKYYEYLGYAVFMGTKASGVN